MDINSKNIKTVNKLPFYEPPPRKTSAEIINEARLAIRESQMADNSFISTSIKPVQTKRPFTPKESERILFGKNVKSKRPPSSFSLRYLQNETNLPVTPPDNGNVLMPQLISSLNNEKKSTENTRSFGVQHKESKIFNIGVKELNINKIKLPALETSKSLLQKRKLQKSTYSLDNLPEEYELSDANERKAFSSPQENTDFNSAKGSTNPQQKSLSDCLLLGPQNLTRIFDNKEIMQNSDTLFSKSGYFNRDIRRNKAKIAKSFSVLEMCDNLKEKTFDDILELLNSEKYKNDEHVTISLLNELYENMQKENMLNININSRVKIGILKCLYKYVESQNEQLLLNIGRIILALKVTGNNLSGVCKLIFKVSKNDKNDHLFFQKNILELFLDALGRCSPLDDAEACVYGYGAIKFLTMNPKLLEKISELGILPLMVLHLKIVNNAKIEKVSIPQHTNHAIFQLTGSLRNLVSEDINYENFISTTAIYQICQSLELFATDLDIVSNISRIFSTISMNECCCDAIVEYKSIFKLFILLFEKYPGNEEITVRLAFTIGNIVAKLDNTRIKFYREEKSVHSLLNLWRIYLENTLKNCSLNLDDKENDNTRNTEDVMIKIIRIIANMVINPEVGKEMNDKYGVQLIDEFLKVLISNPFKKNEELVLSILSTLNNLSYYYTADLDQDIFNMKQIDILEGIIEYTKDTNKECMIETTRILGNLSRSKATRSYISESEIFKTLLKLLNKDDLNLLKTTVGVFVNLMGDNHSRQLFKNESGMSKLISILNKHGQDDWSLAMLVCQAVWNYCIETVNLYELISENELHQLMGLLADFLDEERLFGVSEQSTDERLYATHDYIVWEEFASVATNLLEKIEYFLDSLEVVEEHEESKVNTKDSGTNISFSAW